MAANRQYTQPAGMPREMIQSIYRAPSFGRGWFGRVLPAVRAGDLQAVVHVVGDSITVGDDASSDGSAGAANNTAAQKDAWRADGYVGLLRRGLQQVYGDGGEGYQSFGLAVTTGTWANRVGFGLFEALATAAASATWKVTGTTVRIFYRAAGVTGAWRYQVDGGSFTTVNTAGTGLDPGQVTLGPLSDGEHTIRCEWVSGTVALCGVRGQRGTEGVIVDRIAQHGIGAQHISGHPVGRRQFSVAATLGSNTITFAAGLITAADIGARVTCDGFGLGVQIGAVPTATTATVVDRYGAVNNSSANNGAARMVLDPLVTPPASGVQGYVAGATTVKPGFTDGLGQAHMVVFALGVNDAATGTRLMADTYEEAISRWMRAYSDIPTSDFPTEFVFLVQHIGKWFDLDYRYPWLASAQRQMAAAANGAVIDAWEAGRRSHLYAQQQGYWSGATHENSIHLSKGGHAMVGGALLNLLIR